MLPTITSLGQCLCESESESESASASASVRMRAMLNSTHFGVDGLRRGDVAYLIFDDAVTDESG